MADGVFKAELNEFFTRELAEDGYSGVEVRVTPTRTEIIILATRTQNVLGEKGRRIRELTAVVQKRFNFPEGTVEVRVFVCVHVYEYVYCVHMLACTIVHDMALNGYLFSFVQNMLSPLLHIECLSFALCNVLFDDTEYGIKQENEAMQIMLAYGLDVTTFYEFIAEASSL